MSEEKTNNFIDWEYIKSNCKSIRCVRCGRTIAVANILLGYIEILHKGCGDKPGTLNPIEFANFEELQKLFQNNENDD